MDIFLQGMGIGAGLIMAIGAQNAFVLTQGMRRQHHWLIAFICSVSDMLLIFCGVAGLGAAVSAHPVVQQYAGFIGVLFLCGLGLKAFIGVFTTHHLAVDQNDFMSRKAAVFTILALTFLNPHVYIDTVLLLGTLGGQYSVDERYIFAFGASTSSFLWFFSLSFGGKMLAPLFTDKKAWKILDTLICITMWSIAWQLYEKFGYPK